MTACPVAITGGTGAHNGARGTAFATDVSATSSTIDIELLRIGGHRSEAGGARRRLSPTGLVQSLNGSVSGDGSAPP
jgi:hypothetical protein